MPRFCKRGFPVALTIVITLLYPLLAPPPHRIDEAHFDQIQVGMTLEEVESRFGAPAGNYDWAVAKDPAIWIWDISADLTVNEVVFVPDLAVISSPAQEALVWDLSSVNVSPLRNVTTIHYLSPNSRTWTSRHGTATIHFDQHNRVTSKSAWGETRLEPPWHNWRKWFSK